MSADVSGSVSETVFVCVDPRHSYYHSHYLLLDPGLLPLARLSVRGSAVFPNTPDVPQIQKMSADVLNPVVWVCNLKLFKSNWESEIIIFSDKNVLFKNTVYLVIKMKKCCFSCVCIYQNETKTSGVSCKMTSNGISVAWYLLSLPFSLWSKW